MEVAVTRKMLHHALIDTSGAHYKRSYPQFQKLDLSPGQPKVLSYLNANEGCPQKELAEQCRVEPATMTVLLRSMELKGLIRKQAVYVSGGKRAFGIYLTERGMELALLVDKIIDDLQKISFKGFTPEEEDKLIELLQRVTDNLTKQ
jgi:DNA-binding MarR family transcriptional regulator